MLIGVLLVGLGVWMLTNLFDSVIVLAWIAGVSLSVGGIVEVAALMAFYNRDDPSWTLDVGIGGFGIALGAVVLVWPDITLVVLALSLGIRAVVTGLIAIGTGWQMHRLSA